MLSVSFQGAHKLRRVVKSKSQRYSLNAAQRLLNEAEEYALVHKFNEQVVMVIHGDHDEQAFVDQLDFGQRFSYINNLIAVVQHTLDSELFSDFPAAEKSVFLERLSQQLQAENKERLAAKTMDEHPEATNQGEPLDAIDSVEKQTVAQPPQSPIDQDQIEPVWPTESTAKVSASATQPVSELRQLLVNFFDPKPSKTAPVIAPVPVKEKEAQPAHQRQRTKQTLLKKWGIALGLLVASVLLVALGRGALNNVNQPPTYSALIAKQAYLKAAKVYPKKRADIETKLSAAGRIKPLEQFVKAYPSADGKFDLAFQRRQYGQVVSLSTKAKMTPLRKTMLAVAYVKTGQLDQAAVLNADLKSNKLSLAIALGYVHAARFDEATAINQTLANKTLEQAIDTGSIYQQAIEKYQRDASDKTKSAAARKTAAANVEAFKHQLQTLGE